MGKGTGKNKGNKSGGSGKFDPTQHMRMPGMEPSKANKNPHSNKK